MDFEDVAGASFVVQFDVVAGAVPEIAGAGQQVFGFEGAVLRDG